MTYLALCAARSWMGLEDKTQEGRFVLPSTGREPDYHYWELGQPDDAYHLQDCVTLEPYTGSRVDTFCNEQHAFICERDETP